ncbi:dipeptide/oligopeptide/nickel ABC transporter permease/ATP-binding protein [Nocardiopsis sp. CNS-639]|uniref:dipeptide/oligopeptide/nickel ABC transporter permease/ATP-binding protein n=1 Tax=Nocardiopsis sp. CNS-639 TaxID=1169153 RepID=UPI0003A3DD47|nr:dipeptide/oligopeptide/nickel ABC transporter permease/ATP-binding protein [Nocardiopsis sp. CNS-639]
MNERTPTRSAHPRTENTSLLRRLLRRPLTVLAIVLLAGMTLLVVFGPWITPFDPARPSLEDMLLPPGPDHLLGTDAQGRDSFSRVIAGAPLSIGSGMFALVTAVVLGVVGGLVAGYYGGWFDLVSSWLVGVVMALPSIVMIVAARAVVGPSLPAMMFLLGVFLSPVFFRLVYGAVRAVREELYIDAARVSGLGDLRIIGRHVLSAVRAPIIIQSALVAGMSVSLLAGLEFLGLGNPDTPTWGSLLSAGFMQVHTAPWLVIGPAIALGVTGVAFVLLGNGLRDGLERTTPARRSGKRAGTGRVGPVAAEASAAPSNTDAVDDLPEGGLPETPEGEEPVVHPDPRAGDGDLLRVRGLRVAYTRPDGSETEVVHGVSLSLRHGQIHGLIGESGSGKTQTAFSILGLLPRGGRITAGEIEFEGVRLENADDRALSRVRGSRIGYIPQEPMSNLDPSFTVGSQLVHPLRRQGTGKREAREKVLALLDRVGIPDPRRTFDGYPFEISGGMAQRVLIAGAVSMDPDLLIADEPTTALDVTVQAEVLDLLRDLQEERRLTMLLVTHNVGVVADICDHVTVMRRGRFVETGPTRDVLTSARHPYTRSLLNALLEDTLPRPALLTRTGDHA